jgi:hypothetical protein
MDVNSIVLDLTANGMNASAIHSNLASMLDMKVPGYSTMTRWPVKRSWFNSPKQSLIPLRTRKSMKLMRLSCQR